MDIETRRQNRQGPRLGAIQLADPAASVAHR
jgi:hypothetical protein